MFICESTVQEQRNEKKVMTLKILILLLGISIKIKPTISCGHDNYCHVLHGEDWCCDDGDCDKCTKCFPGISKVLTEGNNTRDMEEIKVGDNILTLEDGKLVPTQVLGFFHKHSNESAFEYLNITMASGINLRISKSHLVFVSEKGDILKSIMAKDVQTGDALVVPDGGAPTTSRVLNIKTEVMPGLYAPLTSADFSGI